MIGQPICGGMNAQLVGAAGIGLHLQPGQRLAGLLDDAVVGNRVVGALFAMLGDAHPVAIGRRSLTSQVEILSSRFGGTPLTSAQ